MTYKSITAISLVSLALAGCYNPSPKQADFKVVPQPYNAQNRLNMPLLQHRVANRNNLPQQQQTIQQAIANLNIEQNQSYPQLDTLNFENIKPLKLDKPIPPDETVIQVALLLDTSNSMDGLISQAKSQLWKIVNELTHARKNGKKPTLQVALYEYGNDKLSNDCGYIRRVQPLSDDLDQLSEHLFSLKTNGGSEYCGHVVLSAVNRLKWNPSDKNLKCIFIAGNEPFTQGQVDYRISSQKAKAKNLIVNTIHCGNHQRGIDTNWKDGAQLADGNYMHIDQNKKLQDVETPYDDQLLELNKKLNATYIPYGARGFANAKRQKVQDSNSSKFSKSSFVSRAVSKSSSFYQNSSWDLVDAYKNDKFDMSKVDRKTIPEDLRNLNDQELKAYVEKKMAERKTIQREIADLNIKRSEYVAKKLKELAKDGKDTLDSAMIAALRKAAIKQGFTFDN